MAPTSQGATNQLISQAEATGANLQNQYNTQAAQTKQQYQDTYNQAQQAYQNLSNYNQQIAGTNYGNVYQQNETAQQQQLGYSPAQAKQANDLALQAVQGATTAENIMGALPQAVNQMGNYSGATAGQVAGNYANMAQNVNQQATNAANLLGNAQGEQGALTGEFNAAAGAANQQVTQQLAGQSLASQNYQALYQNSIGQMQTAGQVMTQVENLQQQQGYLTAEQVKAYQDAYNGYITAQASAESAAAAMLQAQTYAQVSQFSEDQTIKAQQASALSDLKQSGQGSAWVGQDGNLYVKAAGLAGGVVNVGPANSSTVQQVLSNDRNIQGIANPSVGGSQNTAGQLFQSVLSSLGGNNYAPFIGMGSPQQQSQIGA